MILKINGNKYINERLYKNKLKEMTDNKLTKYKKGKTIFNSLLINSFL